MMFYVLIQLWRLVSDEEEDVGVEGWVSMPSLYADVAAQLAAANGLRHYDGYRKIRRRWWDLVILADHSTPFESQVPTVLVRHGLARSTRLVRGRGLFIWRFTRPPARRKSDVYADSRTERASLC